MTEIHNPPPPKLVFTGHVSDDELRRRVAEQQKIAKARKLRQMRETMRHAAHRFALGEKELRDGAAAYMVAALLGAAYDAALAFPGGDEVFMATFATLTGGQVEQVGTPLGQPAPVNDAAQRVAELAQATGDEDCPDCGALTGMKHSASCPHAKE